MTLIEYITNPMGKGNSVFPDRAIKLKFDEEYRALVNRFKISWYIASNNHFIALVQVPSHSLTDLVYTVVLDFDGNSISDAELTINHADMKVFSNCPSFSYTYAYVFYKKGYLCNWLSSKYDNQILMERPESRNANRIIYYERSLYLAIKYILDKGYNRINRIKTLGNPTKSVKELTTQIASQKDKDEEYKRKEKLKSDIANKEKKQQAARDALANAPRHMSSQKTQNSGIYTTKSISHVSGTSKISYTSKTSKISKMSSISKTKKT